ncbi:MAG: 4-diphosphocytidyl-2C-methyl-D-erythritol kinase [Flaviaesturariibacter sp.]|nr:4-diphosphocytidyl-2C-methyl-D-erythritol kinase [Flaviaesturariibacter sp.]
MIVFPNAKINLGLHIMRRRADGFHDLETVFYPIPLHDALEAVPAPDGSFLFTMSGAELDITPENNSCAKAWSLMRQSFPDLPPVHLHLHKALPSGAGLGGGSADAAFTLVLLNRKFNLGATDTDLESMAAKLGSDCAFFIRNTPAFATGRGEVLEPVTLSLDRYRIAIVNPGIHVPTPWAFRQVTPDDNRPSLREMVGMPVPRWRSLLVNDFEKPLFAAHPEIGAVKDRLYAAGATYASMTGSGSTVFGLFDKEMKPSLSFPSHYFFRMLP